MKMAELVFEALKAQSLKLATAESCTGGMVAAAITDIAGSSNVFDRGFVTYSNAAKSEMLAVPMHLIERFGAVSEETAIAMAQGALAHSAADIGVAITGIAGPGGGTSAKPVGLVYFACAMTGKATLSEEQRFGELTRADIRQKSVEQALDLLLRQINI